VKIGIGRHPCSNVWFKLANWVEKLAKVFINTIRAKGKLIVFL